MPAKAERLMRSLLVIFVSALIVTASVDASARGYGGRHYGGHYRGYSGGYYGGHHHNYAPYFVGGMLLGAMLTPPRYYPPPTQVVYVQRPTVVAAPQVVYAQPQASPSAVGRRLLRDLNGDCFERRFDGSGNELRTQLPAAECVW